MMWLEMIVQLDTQSQVISASPATEEQLTEVEKSLDLFIPDNLRRLLRETDGIVNVYGLQIVWSTDLIKCNNLDFRQSGLAADAFVQNEKLFFFADAGNGDEYAFRVKEGQVVNHDIFVWRHEDNQLEWSIASLEEYLRILVSS